MVKISSPFPTKSSIQSQKNCNTNTNNEIRKVARKGPIKARMMSLSSFLITLQLLSQISVMTNVKLSKEELELVTNADLILTKNRIIQKVYELFGTLSEEYRSLSHSLPAEVTAVAPKISKGENYLGLPWVMLDQPRLFSNTDVFAIRSFFWWGKYFSITLQLQGKHKEQYQQVVSNTINNNTEWMVCIAADPWQHHFDSSNYIPYTKNVDLTKLSFIKLAKKIPLQQWDNSFQFFIKTFTSFIEILSPQPVK